MRRAREAADALGVDWLVWSVALRLEQPYTSVAHHMTLGELAQASAVADFRQAVETEEAKHDTR